VLFVDISVASGCGSEGYNTQVTMIQSGAWREGDYTRAMKRRVLYRLGAGVRQTHVPSRRLSP
jgi:hypothetical protein